MIELITIILLIIISLFAIVKGANYLIDGAVDLARWLNVSPMLVGLTIVAFGTSLPEFIISFFSALNGSPDLAVGNVIGSNIVNIGLIIGISASFTPLVVRSTTLMYEFPFLMAASFLLLLLGNNFFLFTQNSLSLGRIDGVIFLIIFLFFLLYIYTLARSERKAVQAEFRKAFTAKNPLWKDAMLIIGGLAALIIGGKLFVNNAAQLAAMAGLSSAFIGLTIAAIGTSLPELATSAVAAWKKESDIAIGNIVGSNIFNILLVLGLTSIFKPLSIDPTLLAVDGMVMIGFTLLFVVFATRNKKILRAEGITLLLCYLAYLAWLVWRM